MRYPEALRLGRAKGRTEASRVGQYKTVGHIEVILTGVALKYVGNDYKQHNPMVEDGKEGFRKFINWIRSDHPESHSEIKQVFADGDYVLLNVHMVRHPGERGLAIGEIFRLEDGKIIEHWDRIQPIPETAKNGNTMF